MFQFCNFVDTSCFLCTISSLCVAIYLSKVFFPSLCLLTLQLCVYLILFFSTSGASSSFQTLKLYSDNLVQIF
jgi:hypothetical protein